MRKISILLMMFCFVCFGVANAQQQTMTIGSSGGLFSTGNSSTGNFVPGSVLGNTYCYRSLTQFIYTASEMGGAKTIKSVAFYHNNGGTFTTQNLTIYLAHTTASTISGSTAVTSGTAYYTGTSVVVGGTDEGWQTFTLDTDFEYNGTDNLLVVVARESSSGYKTDQGWKYTSTASDYRYIYRTSDTNGYGTLSNGNNTYAYTQSYNRPNIQIGYTTTEPFITLDPSAATVFTGFTQTLTATYGNVTNPTITYSSSNTSVATVTGNGTTATVTAVAPGTATITATMNGSYTAICSVTVEDPSYCTPSFGSNNDCITNITLGNINNTTASTSTNGYGDYTSMSTELEPGTTATLSLTSGGGSGTHAAAVWIDFDNSYTFESSERVGTQGSISANATVSINLTIPADAPAGSHRMRVVYQYNVDATAIDPCVSSQYGEAEDYTVVITSPCPKPTGLALSGLATHGVTATWDAEAGDVFQYAMVMGANISPSTVTTYDGSITATGTTCSMGWNNLLADTDYTLVLRKNCGNDEYSIAVTQSFTTLESACLKPTNVTASDVTINSAHISWDGNADSYNVKYATATVNGTTLEPVFEDSFENGLDDWTIYIEGYQSTETNDFNITDWHLIESNSSASPHTGSYMAMSRSYDGNDRTVDNWLVSPQMTLGDVMTFWAIDDGTWHEHLEVWVSTGTNAISDFVKAATPGDATNSWTMKTVDLSAYAGQQGYIAIRHNDTGKDWIFIDDIGVYKTVNTYSYGTFTTLPPTDQNSCDITGLSPETLYVAQVQSDCGSPDGTSSWSSVYFTTPDACSAPTNLVTSNITANTATLSWSDNQDSYNVQYRKVYFYEDFEGASLPTGWTTIDNNGDGNTWSIGFATSHSGDNGAYNLSYVYSSDGSVTTTPDDYLVSPLLDLQGTLRVWLSGYARSSSNYSEHFEILLSTTGNSVSDFTTTLVGETTTTDAYVEYTANLSSYAGQQGYIAIHHFNCTDQYYLYVDDFGLYGTEDWVSVSPNPTDATTTLTGLQPNTGYEWQVQGLNCNSQGSSTDWSAVATFTTLFSVTKDIDGHKGNAGKWYLIASPVTSVTPSEANGFIASDANNYDLYYFDQTGGDNGKEWKNYKQNNFNLVSGTGYLYASKANTTLTFSGTPYSGEGEFQLTYDENDPGNIIRSLNLVGNPFNTNATVDQDFYVMNEEGTDVMAEATAAEGIVEPMQGIFVKGAEDITTVKFTPVSKNNSGNGKSALVMNLSQNCGGIIDRAIVRFGNGDNLPKFQLFENSTKLYIAQDNCDYAIVSSDNEGEMPVNFKAAENGTYTLTISAPLSFNYLHLIDNLTGNDINLLVTPSYSFEAKTDDYASRFKLVFSANDTDNNSFAFISNGEIILNGQGTVQVYDITGRMISSHNNMSRISTESMAAGVYMIRLINGSDVKTQKIVVK